MNTFTQNSDALFLLLYFWHFFKCLDPHFPHQKAHGPTAFQGMGNAGTSVEFATAWLDITWMIAPDAAQALLRRKDRKDTGARPVLQTNVESHVSLMQQVFETWVCWTAACLVMTVNDRVMTRVEENHVGMPQTRPRLWTWYLP